MREFTITETDLHDYANGFIYKDEWKEYIEQIAEDLGVDAVLDHPIIEKMKFFTTLPATPFHHIKDGRVVGSAIVTHMMLLTPEVEAGFNADEDIVYMIFRKEGELYIRYAKTGKDLV